MELRVGQDGLQQVERAEVQRAGDYSRDWYLDSYLSRSEMQGLW